MEDPYRVSRAKHSYGTCKADLLSTCGGRSQNNCWSRVHELTAMVLADAKNIESYLLARTISSNKFSMRSTAVSLIPAGVPKRLRQAIYTDLHDHYLSRHD